VFFLTFAIVGFAFGFVFLRLDSESLLLSFFFFFLLEKWLDQTRTIRAGSDSQIFRVLGPDLVVKFLCLGSKP
jgi:hypothetical protein